ncbi:MAG: hypothetical protein ACYTGC_09845 [Planctomycetota bacterium]|jgi:hypothetical protein
MSVATLPGCQPYRIEYHERPRFAGAAGVETPDQETLDDGTVIVYRHHQPAGSLKQRTEAPSEDGGDRFRIREELDDGTVVLRNLLPEHLLTNIMTCLQNQEYQLIWEQLLAEPTRQAYLGRGGGQQAFEAFFRRYRHELAESINRMSFGLLRYEVVVDNVGGGVSRFRFHPNVASQLKFTTVLMVSEQGQLKLLRIS